MCYSILYYLVFGPQINKILPLFFFFLGQIEVLVYFLFPLLPFTVEDHLEDTGSIYPTVGDVKTQETRRTDLDSQVT